MKTDLHLHTIYSDGSLKPTEIIERAKSLGVCAIAITDHDECRGCLEIKSGQGIDVVCGVELSADYRGEVHVLGYNIDCHSKELISHIEEQSKSRINRARKMIELFKSNGVDLTMDDVLSECKGDVLGRPHFAEALIKKGEASSVKQAFGMYLDKNARCYVPRQKVDIKKAAELILSAGGLPVVAHPGLIPGSVWNELSGKLKEWGFWGIEAYHPSHSLGQCREFESYAKRSGLFVTSGSDFHGGTKPDIEIGQEQRGGRFLEESLEELGVKCR